MLLDLLDGWGDVGHRVVLADGVLEHPTLHRSVGLRNEEGITDAALFGASVSRVARPVPGRAFFFVGAGSPTGDAETVLSSARWVRLQDGFREAGVTFVVYIREGCAGEAGLIGGADDLIVLSETAESVPAGAHDAPEKVRAVIGPNVDRSAAADTGEPVEKTAPLEAVGAAAADPLEALVPGLHDQPVASEDEESVMDFSEAPGADPEASGSDPETSDREFEDESAPSSDRRIHAPEAEPAAAPEARPVHTRRRSRGADPDARKKLLWVALAVLVLVVLVVLGALR